MTRNRFSASPCTMSTITQIEQTVGLVETRQTDHQNQEHGRKTGRRQDGSKRQEDNSGERARRPPHHRHQGKGGYHGFERRRRAYRQTREEPEERQRIGCQRPLRGHVATRGSRVQSGRCTLRHARPLVVGPALRARFTLKPSVADRPHRFPRPTARYLRGC